MPELSITHELRTGSLKKINIKDFNTDFNYNIVVRKHYSFLSDAEEKFLSFLLQKRDVFVIKKGVADIYFAVPWQAPSHIKTNIPHPY